MSPAAIPADFIDIVTFDKLAAVCAQWLTKGREVAVVGKLRFSEWTGRDGERRSKLQVSHPNETRGFAGDPGVADAVQFLGQPTKAGPDGGVADTDDKPADRPAIGKYREAS